MGNLCWKMFSWRIKDHSCCHPQAKIISKSYLSPSSNLMALFQSTYCCIFTLHNLTSYCKGLKSYYFSKSLAPLGSKMSTTQSLLLLIITQWMVKNARSQWPTTWQESTYRWERWSSLQTIQVQQRIIYQHCQVAPLNLTQGQQKVQLNLLPKHKVKAATICWHLILQPAFNLIWRVKR